MTSPNPLNLYTQTTFLSPNGDTALTGQEFPTKDYEHSLYGLAIYTVTENDTDTYSGYTFDVDAEFELTGLQARQLRDQLTAWLGE